MMSTFLVYIASISDNLHNFASIALIIAGFSFIILGWTPLFDDKRNTFNAYIFPNIKKILVVLGIIFAIFMLTPSDWKHSMDTQYIEENSKLRQEINNITQELNTCAMRRGKYSCYDENFNNYSGTVQE